MIEKNKCCETCNCCICVENDDYICDKHNVIVMEDAEPNNNYNYCNECDWEDE